MRLILIFCVFIVHIQSECKVLEYSEARSLALQYSPNLKIVTADLYSKDAELRYLPIAENPDFALEFEDFGGSGRYRGTKSLETTYAISQPIELSNKRDQKRKAIASEINAAYWEQEKIKMDILHDLRHAMIETSAAQEEIKFYESLVLIIQEKVNATQAQIENGKLSPTLLKTGLVELRDVELSLGKAKRKFETSKQNLIYVIGCPYFQFDSVEFPLEELFDPPDFEAIAQTLCQYPEYLKKHAELHNAKHLVAFEYANRIPNLVVAAGIKTHAKSHDHSLLLGFEMTLPIFDQNRAEITKSRYTVCQQKYALEQYFNQYLADLQAAHEAWVNAYQETQHIKLSSLGSAEESFLAAKEEFEQGKYDYFYLLEAQRAHANIKKQYLDSIGDTHHKQANFERLLGISWFDF